MLSSTSKQEILNKLEVTVGHPIDERGLSPATRKAVASLAEVQRSLSVIGEIANGEEGRVQGSMLLSLASKVHKDKGIAAHEKEMAMLQDEVRAKVAELSAQIVQEEMAKDQGQPPPERKGGVEAVQLKCPDCGAALPMPAGRFVKCQYCGATLSVEEVSSQIKEMIRKI